MSSSCEEDILRIKKRLEKMMKLDEIDVKISLDMLNTLKNLPIDLTILKNTGIGVSLNNLRKSCNSEELGTLAKTLLKNWKKLVATEASQQANTNSNNSAMSPNSNSNDSSPKPQSPAAPTPSTPVKESLKRAASESPENLKSESKQSPKSNGAPVNNSNGNSSSGGSSSKKQFTGYVNPLARHISYTETKDPVRQKCREMLAAALELTESIENGATLCDANEIAGRCEDVIFNEFKDTGMKYKNRIRSRVINLKDARNPRFRENVRLGLITADRLAIMTAEEMASDELKELRAKFTKEAIDDHQMARTQGAKTSLLTCSKCKKNNVVYSEMQTRSADEPMTTFAYCQECGHRWKFC